MTTRTQISPLPTTLQKELAASENVWVRLADDHIEALNQLCARLPTEYGWRFKTAEALKAEATEICATSVDGLPINRLFWRDQLGCCEAYGLLSTWRMVDLARGCVSALARNDVVGAALLARSSLESSAQFVDVARKISATLVGTTKQGGIGGLLDPSIDFRKHVVSSQDFEDLLLKTLFATRLPGTDDFYQATNIVTIIKNISKIKGQDSVAKTYELLCEVAHPNFLGKSIYLLRGEPGFRAGEELRIIGPGNGPASTAIIEASVEALSWACGTNVSAFALLSETLRALLNKLETA